MRRLIFALLFLTPILALAAPQQFFGSRFNVATSNGAPTGYVGISAGELAFYDTTTGLVTYSSLRSGSTALTPTSVAITSTGLAPLTVTSTDATATESVIDLYRNSASPAAADALSTIQFSGKDDGATKTTYASIGAEIADVGAVTKDGRFILELLIDGTVGEIVRLTHLAALTFLGDRAASVLIGRRTATSDVGTDLTVKAGGATASGTNLVGGTLVLSGGISTGSGTSDIEFWTATAGGSGTADVNPTLKGSIDGPGVLDMAGGYEVASTTRISSTGVFTGAAGSDFAGVTFATNTIYKNTTNGSVTINGGSTGNFGAAILYGQSHATKAGDVSLLYGSTERFGIDGPTGATTATVSLYTPIHLYGETTASSGDGSFTINPTTDVFLVNPTCVSGATITDITEPNNARRIQIINIGAVTLTITHDAANVSAIDATSIVLGANDDVELLYSPTQGYWRQVSDIHEH